MFILKREYQQMYRFKTTGAKLIIKMLHWHVWFMSTATTSFSNLMMGNRQIYHFESLIIKIKDKNLEGEIIIIFSSCTNSICQNTGWQASQ